MFVCYKFQHVKKGYLPTLNEHLTSTMCIIGLYPILLIISEKGNVIEMRLLCQFFHDKDALRILYIQNKSEKKTTDFRSTINPIGPRLFSNFVPTQWKC